MKNIHFAMYSISFFFLLVKFCIFKIKTLFYKHSAHSDLLKMINILR